MKKSSNRKIRKEYTAMIACIAITVITIIALLVFSLLPLYSVVGNEGTQAGSSVVDRSSSLNSVLLPVLFLSFLFDIVFLILGMLKDVRSKSQK